MILDDIKAACDTVLAHYVADHGCPCSVPQFVYWVSKEQGPGWQDHIQNELVSSASGLPFFIEEGVATPIPFTDVKPFKCTHCGQQWTHTRYEWRNLAYWDRLLPVVDQAPPPERFTGKVGAYLFCTLGFEPTEDAQRLSLEEWQEFMFAES